MYFVFVYVYLQMCAHAILCNLCTLYMCVLHVYVCMCIYMCVHAMMCSVCILHVYVRVLWVLCARVCFACMYLHERVCATMHVHM